MTKEVVGNIDGNDVIYVLEKDILFCKNTTVSYPIIERIIRSANSREEIPEKNLTIHKDGDFINFGCLHTTLGNCREINKNVKKFKKLNV